MEVLPFPLFAQAEYSKEVGIAKGKLQILPQRNASGKWVIWALPRSGITMLTTSKR
jgi:hypothetical protein